MKTRNLSLAILVALGVAACGSSNDGGSKKPNKPEQPEQPVKPDPKPEVEDTVVDPTQNDVVKAFKLTEKPSVGSVTYIRGEKSQFNINEANKEKNSATSVFLGLDLDSQNPHLTNIVLGKLKDKKVAQFAGSRSQSFETGANPRSLQAENVKNVASIEEALTATKYSYLNGLFNKVDDKTKAPTKADGTDEQEIGKTLSDYLHLVNVVNVKKAELDKAIAEKADVSAAATAYNTALNGLYDKAKAKKIGFELAAKKAGIVLSGKAINLSYVDEEGKARPAKTDGTEAAVVVSVTPDLTSWMDYARTLGYDVIDFDTAKTHGETLATGSKTLDLGLVTIDYSKADGKADVRGVENQESQTQTTRIFGHYYLAPKAAKQADGNTLEIDVNEDSEILNSYSAPIVYKKDNQGTMENALGAVTQALNHVQYGRVTAQVDPDSGEDVGVNGNWKLKRVNFASKMGESSADSVDYYFARGTGETSLAEMSNLPKESLIVYRGHAISWGVNNEYNFGKDIPNAFGTSTKRGIGNFVYAELDTGKNSFAGNIYNSWVDVNEQDKITSTKADKRRLIDFKGDVVGNSVVGTAKLAYDASKTGELRATFYGKNADEVGGSVNSTTYKEIYKDAEWGAVFGAKRVETPEEVIIKKDSNQWLGDTEQ